MKTIDLNADLGEGTGNDAALLDIVSSANIACGGHAGDATTMRQTLRLAHKKGVTCGAHPGFIDKENFGRARLQLSEAELRAQIHAQLKQFLAIAADEKVPVRYLKLHGAMANMTAQDQNLAEIVFGAAAERSPNIAILALDNSAQIDAADKLGLPVIREAYADRAYTAEGLLATRGTEGAVITDPIAVIFQTVQLATMGTITALDGSVLKSEAKSICLHGDTNGAVHLAQQIRTELENNAIAIQTVL